MSPTMQTTARHLAETMAANGLTSLSVTHDGVAYVMRRNERQHRTTVRSPEQGVYHDRPLPDEPPYVAVGDPVGVGQAVAAVMVGLELFEVVTEVAGVVEVVHRSHGAAVAPGTPLVTLAGG